MDFETIIFKKEGHIATITLNRPEKLNALSDQMIKELIWVCERINEDSELRVLVLTGDGEAFCAGGEIMERQVISLKSEQEPMQIRQNLRKGAQRAILGLRNLDIPTIAMVNGAAVGGGFDLALACDIRIGSERTKFKVAFTSIGLFPGTGGIWLMPRVIGVSKAAEYLFTDELIEAQEAEKLGILNRLVSSEKLEEETMKMARRIANGPPIALKLAKVQLYKGLQTDLGAAMEDAAAYETITWTSCDIEEGIAAFREKRPPFFEGK